MSKRNYLIFIKDIYDSLVRIDEFVKGYGLKELENDDKTLSAVIRKLEIIGEAAKGISPEIKAEFPQLDWRGMAGLRDKLIHDYSGIDTEILWQVIKDDLPGIRPEIEKILRNAKT